MSGGADPRDELPDHLPALRAFAISLCGDVTMADDLVQDTIVKAWTNIDKFAVGTNLRAWLFTILRNTFFSIRRKRKQAIALTEELLRSAFLDMFGDPVANPRGWQVREFGDVIEDLDAGWSANGEARQREDDEYGVLKVSAVTSGIFRPEEHKAVAAAEIDRKLITPRAGDLLFSRANTRELVAATCLVEQDSPRLFLPDKLWRIMPNESEATAPYLRFLLSHDRLRYELTRTATGTSGSMLNISMGKLRALRVPIPPVDMQAKFSALVWDSLRAKARTEQAQRESELLFESLVARAFSGALAESC